METLLTFLMAVAGLLLLTMVRNTLIYRIRSQAITEIFSHKDWEEKLSLLHNPGYFAMVFDLTKWTFKGFFPEHHARRVAREIAKQDG